MRSITRQTLAIAGALIFGGGFIAVGDANAASAWRGCKQPNAFPLAKLTVRGMDCRDGKATINRLFRTTHASSTPFGVTKSYRVGGRTDGPTGNGVWRRFTCAVRYGHGTGSNYGGIQLSVRCHDYTGDGIRYGEEQDNE